MKSENTNYELNPYINARREWTERYGDYITRARNWRFAAALSFLTTLILAVGLSITATQSKIIPYIIEVDKLGKVAAIAPAEELKQIDTKIIKSVLANFIIESRSVSTDRAIQKRALERIYAYLPRGSSAATYIKDYISHNNPFILAETKTVTVEVSTVLPLSEKSWQAEWQETSHDLQGSLINRKKWKAIISIEFSSPTTEAAIIANPLGLFITQISWAQQL